jgi:hypothetical protein
VRKLDPGHTYDEHLVLALKLGVTINNYQNTNKGLDASKVDAASMSSIEAFPTVKLTL